MASAFRTQLTSGFLGLSTLVAAVPCVAHPHVMISAEVTFEVRGGALTVIKERWTFDEAYRKSNLEEYDKNGNGVLDENELEAFRKLSIATLKRFDNFTTVWTGKTKARLADAVFTSIDMQAARPVIEFHIGLLDPLPLTKATTIEVNRPGFAGGSNS